MNPQELLEYELLSFFGWWELAVCLFAFSGLMGIWWHIGRKQGDFGQVWLALSVLCWSVSGGVEVIFANHPDDYSSYRLEGLRSILSLFNSLFILLALPWFRYLPKQIESVVKSTYWRWIVGLPFLFSLIPTIRKMVSGQSMGAISELDVYYSILTLGFLGYVLWESFAKRRLKILAWLSLVCVLITFVAQWLKIDGSAVNLTLFSAIFKTSLIMIFFALALSWVKELAENVIPESAGLFIKLGRRKKGETKTESFVKFEGIRGVDQTEVVLTPALFDLLLAFAERQKEGEGWLEIKPKNEKRSSREYDIRDHNEVKRLLHALLDGLFGKGLWSKDLHEAPLRSSLFEMSASRDRKIRLRVPDRNITMGFL